ncbi:MAG: DUF2829 domain-containing protein [Lachnospiraceae bacterium]|nr:DUF2829 domain-containing protein [Lachnospiraceae bacterium]
MKNYVGTKFIEAREMTRGEYNDYRGWKIPENENPADKGYLVKYSDGYESWSPKDVFEEAYKECNGMTFGIAVELLKKGFKVAREGWNGKGMYLFLAHGEDIQSCTGINEKCVDVICMKTAQDTVVFGWLASQTDMLAEDWVIVE